MNNPTSGICPKIQPKPKVGEDERYQSISNKEDGKISSGKSFEPPTTTPNPSLPVFPMLRLKKKCRLTHHAKKVISKVAEKISNMKNKSQMVKKIKKMVRNLLQNPTDDLVKCLDDHIGL